MGQGIAEAQADAAALEAAKAFRAELVEKGILSEPKPRDPNFISEVPGVKWMKRKQKWEVLIRPSGGKGIYGGIFTEKAAAEAKALELVEKAGLQRQVKARGHPGEQIRRTASVPPQGALPPSELEPA